MKLPLGFSLNGSRWRLEYVPEPPLHDGRKCRGLCHMTEKRIEIWTGQTLLMLLATVIHETLHACEEEFSIKIPHPVIFAVEKPLARLLLGILQARK